MLREVFVKCGKTGNGMSDVMKKSVIERSVK